MESQLILILSSISSSSSSSSTTFFSTITHYILQSLSTAHLPIIRRSGGIPFIANALLTVLHNKHLFREEEFMIDQILQPVLGSNNDRNNNIGNR